MKTPTPSYRWNKLRKRLTGVSLGLGITTKEIHNLILKRINDEDYIHWDKFRSGMRGNSSPKPEIVLALLELLQIMEASTSREEVVGYSRESDIHLLLRQNI